MSNEILACPEQDGKTTQSISHVHKTREYIIHNKTIVDEIINPAGKNGKEQIYNIDIVEVKTNLVKKITKIAWVEDSDEFLKKLFYNEN
jgi:hypothetical protein